MSLASSSSLPGALEASSGSSTVVSAHEGSQTQNKEGIKNEEILSKDVATPLPKLQLFTLMLIQLGEPIVSKVIFPFVNQFVRQTGIIHGDEANTGYYSGLIESAFYATEALCVLQWGRASDRFGRKPILLTGLFGLALSTITFGLSRQYWSAVLARCAEGALCGNIGVAKSMLAEMTDPSNRAEAFAYLPMVWAVGGTLSPIIGGVLAEPAERWPNTIGKLSFFRHYPYILPCIMAACVPLVAFLTGLLFLKETIPSRRRVKGSDSTEEGRDFEKKMAHSAVQNLNTIAGVSEEIEGRLETTNEKDNIIVFAATTSTNDSNSEKTNSPSIRSLLTRPVLIAIINYALLAFFDQCMAVLLPLVYSSSFSLGGLGFSSFTIGLVQGVWGVLNGIFSILCFPRLLRAFGVKTLYTASAVSCFAALMMFFPMSALARYSNSVDARIWVVIVIQLMFYILAYMGYGTIFIFLNDGAPANARGKLNGLAQMTVSVMRAVAPSTAASLFAASTQHNLAGGYLVYVLLCLITIVGVLTARLLKNK